MKKLHLLFIMLVSSVAMQAQITSNFLVQSYNPCTVNNIPLTVSFQDLSISTNGNITNWTWEFGDGSTSVVISPTHTYALAGSYTVCLTVENINGDMDTECKTNYISYANTPVCIIDPPNELNCFTTSVVLDGSLSTFGGNITYEWTDDNNTVLGFAPTLQVNQAGNYTLTVTENTVGCSAQSTVTVTQNISIPTATASVTSSLDCNNTSVVLDGTGSSTGANITYEWTNPVGIVVANTLNVEVFEAGTYTLIVSDASNGCTSSAQVVVMENIPTYILTPNQVVCNNQLVQIALGPDCTNCSITVTDTFGINPCAAIFPCQLFPSDGPFIITVTDLTSNCTIVDTTSFGSSTPITITSQVISDATCNGSLDGEITINVTGGTPPYIYNWSTGDMTQTLSNVGSGTYALTVMDVNGCTLSESFVVGQPDAIQILNANVVDASCFGNNDGSIDITVAGGTPSFTYDWSNGVSSQDVTGLSPDIYEVTITDANGCTLTQSYTVSQTSTIISFMTLDTTICFGDMLPLNVDAPTAVSYSWFPSTGLSDPTISNPTANPIMTTTYSVTATDASGCSEVGTVTINVNNYLDFGLLQFSNAPICEDDTLELYANLGTTFIWTGPNGFTSNFENPIIPNATANNSGIYSLVITDFYGCTAAADVDVFIDDDCVYPGDTDTNMVVNHFDLLNIGLAYDSTGPARQNASLNWVGQPSDDWSQSTPNTNVNYKHIDADGNGVINSLDTIAIVQNLGQTYNFNDQMILNQFNDLPNSSDGILTVPFYVEPDTLEEGETVSLDIILGDVSNVVTGLYGIGFSLEYDSSIVVPNTAKIDFTNTWLGTVNADAISVQFDYHSPGRIDAAITRIDGVEMDGFGIFGEFIITLEDDILLWDPNKEPETENANTIETEFSITNYHLINFSQEEIPVQAITTTATIDGTTNLNQVELDKLIEVYPNPANDLFFIASESLEIEKARIYSASGNLHQEKITAQQQVEFSIEGLTNGIYFIEIQTREGIVIKKLSIVK